MHVSLLSSFVVQVSANQPEGAVLHRQIALAHLAEVEFNAKISSGTQQKSSSETKIGVELEVQVAAQLDTRL